MEQCRAITFVNFHIPRTEIANDKDIQYTTLGFFDGMLTKKFEICNGEDELNNLWGYMLERTAKSVGQYSYQNVFCFVQDERNSCKDEEMWAEQTDRDWPLVFVVFLQLQHYASRPSGIAEQCQELNGKIKEKLKNQGIYYTYSTVDKNDFVVCIKCRNYRLAVEAIKNLHNIKDNVVYSYSVFSISNKVLKDFDEKQYQDIFHERIDSICLKGVTNSFPTNNITLDQKYREYSEMLVDKLYGGTEDDYRIYDILGDDDFRLIARNVSLGRLLKEYAEGGLLDSHREQVRFYLFSSSMVLNTKTPNQEMIQKQVIIDASDKMNEEFQAVLCDRLEERMSEISARVKKHADDSGWKGQEKIATFCSAIWQLLQSLKALEIPKTKKYDFWSIYHPLAQLIIILEDKMKHEKNLAELSSREEIYEFIHKISMTLHGTLRTDIQFFQIRDFNAMVHYAPAKLRAFYSLWALRLSDYYSEFGSTGCKKSYSFILAPGMFSKVTIKQLFEDDAEKDRLMLISVPERQLYMLKGLAVMLGHEVSHYVGAEVRQRPARHKAMVGITTRLLALEMNYYRWKVCRDKWKVEIGKIIAESKLSERLETVILLADDEVRRKWRDMADKYHSQNSIKIVKKAYQDFAKTYLTKVIGEDCEMYNKILREANSKLPIQERIAESQEIRQLTYEMEKPLAVIYQKFQGQMDSFLGIFFHIVKEVCADINSILTLELTPEEYLQSFSGAEDYFDEQNAVDGVASLRTVRHALVLEAVKGKIEGRNPCFCDQDFPDNWLNFNIERYALDQPVNSAKEKAALWIIDYLDKTKKLRDINRRIGSYQCTYDYGEECFQPRLVDFINDKIIWEKMLSYGTACVESYFIKLTGESGRPSINLIEQKQILVKTYRGLTKGSVDQQLQTIEDFLCHYEQIFQK